MEEQFPKSERATDWLDVTIEQLEDDMENGKFDIAFRKAKYRFDKLWELYRTDLDDAKIRDAGHISTEEWQKQEDAIVQEMNDLLEIMRRQAMNLSYDDLTEAEQQDFEHKVSQIQANQ